MIVTIELTDEQLASLNVADAKRPYGKAASTIKSSKDAAAYLSHLEALKQEHSVVITLTTRSRVIRRHVISKARSTPRWYTQEKSSFRRSEITRRKSSLPTIIHQGTAIHLMTTSW